MFLTGALSLLACGSDEAVVEAPGVAGGTGGDAPTTGAGSPSGSAGTTGGSGGAGSGAGSAAGAVGKAGSPSSGSSGAAGNGGGGGSSSGGAGSKGGASGSGSAGISGAAGTGSAGGAGASGGAGCATGLADCNSTPSDGCEVNLATDAGHCGACNVACTFPNASAACIGGACQIGACKAGFHDCDGKALTGCESAAATDSNNCGSCGVSCAVGMVCVVGACAPPPCTGQVGLPGVPMVPVGVAPSAVASADLDGDGKVDLVVVNAGDVGDKIAGSVSVLLGHGNGTFTRTDFPTALNALAVAVSDLDGDGRPDLAVSHWFSSTTSILRNLGDGNFAAKEDYPGGGRGITAADFDGDGHADLAVIGYPGILFFKNQGDGTFAPKVDFPLAQEVGAIAAGDVDGDGKPDLVALDFQGFTKVRVFRNLGDGTFGPAAGYPAGLASNHPTGTTLRLADLNGDGKADIVVASDGVSVIFNQGDGTFAPRVMYPTAGGTNSPRSVAVDDFDSDGHPDLAVAIWQDGDNGINGQVSILRNQGDGAFPTRVDYLVGVDLAGIAAADLDGDGKADLAVSDTVNHADAWRGNTVDILANRGDGTFVARHDRDASNGPGTVAVGDIDGDGKLDLAVANQGTIQKPGNTVSVFLGDGSGGLGAKVDYPTGAWTSGLALSDLDGDGTLDLAVSADESTDVGVLLNQGDGTFGARVDYPVGDKFARAVAAADFDGDGKTDLATLHYQGAVSILFNKGGGAFKPKVSYPVGASTSPGAFVAADFNGDGRPDLAVAALGTDTLSILMNKGNGTFSAKVDYPAGDQPYAISAGDLNGDGKLDLAVVSSPDTTKGVVRVFLNGGNGTFSHADFPAGPEPNAVTMADLDGNGTLDLAIASYWGVSVLLNNGKGGFKQRVEYGTGGRPVWVAAGDLDGDGRIDLVTANYFDSTLSLLMNRCLP